MMYIRATMILPATLRDFKDHYLYGDAISLVLIGEKRNNWFKLKLGVKQGCVVPLYSFSVFLEFIMNGALG